MAPKPEEISLYHLWFTISFRISEILLFSPKFDFCISTYSDVPCVVAVKHQVGCGRNRHLLAKENPGSLRTQLQTVLPGGRTLHPAEQLGPSSPISSFSNRLTWGPAPHFGEKGPNTNRRGAIPEDPLHAFILCSSHLCREGLPRAVVCG
jgi:hypothetical protein